MSCLVLTCLNIGKRAANCSKVWTLAHSPSLCCRKSDSLELWAKCYHSGRSLGCLYRLSSSECPLPGSTFFGRVRWENPDVLAGCNRMPSRAEWFGLSEYVACEMRIAALKEMAAWEHRGFEADSRASLGVQGTFDCTSARVHAEQRHHHLRKRKWRCKAACQVCTISITRCCL